MYRSIEYKNKVKKILYYLNSKERTIAELLYGLNDKKQLSKDEIVQKLLVAPTYVDYVEKAVDEKIIMYLRHKPQNAVYTFSANDFYEVEKVDREKLKLIFKMSDAFFSFFKGTDPIIVEEKMNILPKKQKDIISLYYGLDGIHCLDYDDLAVEYKLSIEKIDTIITQGISKLKKIINPPVIWQKEKIPTTKKGNKYITLCQKYGKENLEELISYFEKEKQEQLMYILDGTKSIEEIADKLNITYKNASLCSSAILHTIEFILDGVKDNTSQKKFYQKFKNSTKEQVDNAINNLSLRDKLIVKSYFGINSPKMTIPEIAKKIYVDEEKVVYLLAKSRQKILNRLKKEQTKKQIH